jgi:hypothetical protein
MCKKGYKFGSMSKWHRDKISKALKGNIPNNIPNNKGIKRTEEQKEKNRLWHTGRKASDATKNKMSISHKQIVHTKEHNNKVSLAKKGKPNKKIRGSNH